MSRRLRRKLDKEWRKRRRYFSEVTGRNLHGHDWLKDEAGHTIQLSRRPVVGP
jgi:hypothetical protein